MTDYSYFALAISCLVIFGAIIGYLNGSVMWAIIISKGLKKDVRLYESKNPGATNSARVLGKKWGLLVLILDTLKAMLPILLFFLIYKFSVFNQEWWTIYAYGSKNPTELFWNPDFLVYLPGFCAVIGHVFPIFFKFKGGKGISCIGGCFLMISPFIAILGSIIIILCIVITRYVSLGSVLSVLISPLFLLIPGINYFYLIYPNIVECVHVATSAHMVQFLFPIAILIGLGILLTWKHKPNLIAVKNKQERKFSFGKSTWVGNNESYEQNEIEKK